MTFQKTAITLALVGALAGCGSGGDDDDTLAPSDGTSLSETRLFSNGDLSPEPTLGNDIPVGVYQYTSTLPDTGGEQVGLSIISQTGRVAFAQEASISFARIKLDENGRFSVQIESSETESDNIPRILKGARDTGVGPESLARVSGSILNDDTGELLENYRLDLQEADERTLTLNSLAATYSGISETGVGTAISFASDGSLVGSDTTGCDFAGEVVVPDPSVDVIEASFTAKNCGPTVGIEGKDRNGDWFAVGRLDVATGTLTLFGTNGTVGARVTATDNDPGDDVVLAGADFLTNDFSEQPSIAARLEPGTYNYTDIPLDSGSSFVESGLMVISNTGRVVVATDRRLGFSRIQVNDVDTFRSSFSQTTTPGTSQPPSAAEELFGTPNNSGGGDPFTLAGSLLDGEGELLNRYSAERDTSNDATFAATPLDLTQLTGTYSGTRNPGSITTSLTIASDGAVTGSDTTGCVYNGTSAIPNGEAGLFEVRVDTSNCSATTTATGAERDGEYHGVGDFLPGSPDRIRLLLGSADNIEFITLDRQ